MRQCHPVVRSTLTLLVLQRQISTTQRTRTRSRSRYPHLRLPLRSTLVPWSCIHSCSPPYLFPFVQLFPFDMLIARHVYKSSGLGAWNIQYPFRSRTYSPPQYSSNALQSVRCIRAEYAQCRPPPSASHHSNPPFRSSSLSTSSPWDDISHTRT